MKRELNRLLLAAVLVLLPLRLANLIVWGAIALVLFLSLIALEFAFGRSGAFVVLLSFAISMVFPGYLIAACYRSIPADAEIDIPRLFTPAIPPEDESDDGGNP